MTSTSAKSHAKSHPAERLPSPERPRLNGIAAVSAAAHEFLVQEFGAKEVRIIKIAAAAHGGSGWVAEAEILVPNLAIRALNLDLSQEVLERVGYEVLIDATYAITGFEPIDV